MSASVKPKNKLPSTKQIQCSKLDCGFEKSGFEVKFLIKNRVREINGDGKDMVVILEM